MLEHLLTELTEKLQLPLNLEKNTLGYYTITLNQETELLFKELQPGFTCKSLIAEIPKENPLEDLYILLMRANFLGQGTKNGAIAIDENVKNIIFTMSVPEDLQYRLFKDKVEEFVNYLNYWKKCITDEKYKK